MSSTKKGFLYAGGILAILTFVAAVIISIYAIGMTCWLGDASALENLIITYNTNNPTNIIIYTASDLDAIASIVVTIGVMLAIYVLALGILSLIFGIKVIKLGSACSDKKGAPITLLVVSALSGNLITMAFMIVSICLKFNKTNAVDNSRTVVEA